MSSQLVEGFKHQPPQTVEQLSGIQMDCRHVKPAAGSTKTVGYDTVPTQQQYLPVQTLWVMMQWLFRGVCMLS
jgi:hypothetical protein